MVTWKKRNGCGYNQKVYIVKGGYYELRRTLAEKGWFENEDVYSRFFDLKWTTQTCDIDFGSIKPGQAVNHFNNNHHLTSKYGLARRLKTLIIQHGIDIDKFYPRCFDLADLADF
jgi:tubulin monoglycylase TTLL3/8